VKPWEIKIKS